MSNTLQDQKVHTSSASDDQKSLAKLYDEHAAVVLGFLEKIACDRAKAEELLQAVFLSLPTRLHEFDAQKGRFVVWLLKLARTMAGNGEKNPDFKANGSNTAANPPIRDEKTNVDLTDHNSSRPLTTGRPTSVVELLYVKGYTFAEAAAEMGVSERSLQFMVRTELKKYRR